MTQRSILFLASLSGALAVALGAFGEHLLSDLITDARMKSYQTAARYHLIHSVLLVVIALSGRPKTNRKLHAFRFIAFGVLLFSGSLYTMVILHALEVQADWLGAVTPAGGVLLIIGWLLVARLFRP